MVSIIFLIRVVMDVKAKFLQSLVSFPSNKKFQQIIYLDFYAFHNIWFYIMLTFWHTKLSRLFVKIIPGALGEKKLFVKG